MNISKIMKNIKDYILDLCLEFSNIKKQNQIYQVK